MPLNKRNVPLPPDDDGDEDVLASGSLFRYLPERHRAPEPAASRTPGTHGGRPR